MSTYTLTHDRNKTFNITQNYSDWVIAKGTRISVTDSDGVLAPVGVTDITLTLDGEIVAGTVNAQSYAAIFINDASNHVIIDSSGRITTALDYGVALAGAGDTLVNKGEIHNTQTEAAFGVAAADGAQITNDGLIQGADAGVGYGGVFKNMSDGIVKATNIAVELGADDTKATLINDGKLISSHFAVKADDLKNSIHVTNHGAMTGDVMLTNYDDVLDTRTGTISGEIRGMKGDDTYLVSNAKLTITENTDGGTDTVKSTVSYTLGDNIENLVLLGKTNINATGNSLDNHLTGNAGNNVISGGDGLDFLDGGKGNDTLTGGDGQDNFVFDKGNGVDTITDFTHGSDYVDILKFSQFTEYESLASHIKQHGDDTWITLGDGDKIILQHVTASTLTTDDFVFA